MSGHPIFAAVYGAMARSMEAGPIGDARRELLRGARGVVVDLGSGIGLNLPHLGDAVTAVHLIEPDPHMVRRLNRRIEDGAAAGSTKGVEAGATAGTGAATIAVHQVGAEALPLPDASVDTVLATLTLCTVDDLAASVGQIRRVLRPGGQLLVLEHVRSTDARLARRQDSWHGPWRWFAAGCHSNRDTPAALAAVGFDVSVLDRFTVPALAPTREWVSGTLGWG